MYRANAAISKGSAARAARKNVASSGGTSIKKNTVRRGGTVNTSRSHPTTQGSSSPVNARLVTASAVAIERAHIRVRATHTPLL